MRTHLRPATEFKEGRAVGRSRVENQLTRLAVVVAFALGLLTYCSGARALPVTLRLGQGGLRDERPDDGKLGAGQLALDVKLGKLPIALSVAQEYYKKSPEAEEAYEIQSLVVTNALYVRTPIERRAKAYLGGGIGVLWVPKGADGAPDEMERGIMFDLAGGVNVRAFWKIGVYIEGKYIYASKTRDGVKVIDFSNGGALVGVSLNLDW